MKVYLAAPYSLRNEIRYATKALLEDHGHTVTSRWLEEAHAISPASTGPASGFSDEAAAKFAMDDLEDIRGSQALVMYTGDPWKRDHHTGGRHLETGYALGLGIPVLIFGPEPENIFHRLPGVLHRDIRGVIQALSDLQEELS